MEDLKFVVWDELMQLSRSDLERQIDEGGPSGLIIACCIIIAAEERQIKMDLSDEHTVLIYKEPGETAFRVICETCGKVMQDEKGSTRFPSYPDAYGAAVDHERRDGDDEEREG